MAGERSFPKGMPTPTFPGAPDEPGRPILPGKPGAPTPTPNPITEPPTRTPPSGGKPGGPDDGREPPFQPPSPTPPGTPPGRPTLPGAKPPTPIDLDGRTPPPKENPDEQGNFDKGQVRDILTPNGMGSPTDPGGLGTFNPFNSGWGSRGGAATAGRTSTYDPLGIGQDNYGLSRPIGNRGVADGSSENVYGMTGVNAATGYNGPARFGVVGGQGGYGSGMVAPEYTGPQFDSAKDVLKAYRQQRRRGERPGIAQPAKPGGGIGGGSGGGGAVGGGPGTPPPGSGGWTKDMNYGQKPGAPAANAGGAGGADAGGKPGAPASGQETTTAAAGGGAAGGGAGGKPGAPTPAPAPAPGAPTAGGGAGAWNPAWGKPTDQFGNEITPEQYAQRQADFRQGGLGSMLSSDMFQTQYGMLTRDSGGNSNVFKKNGASDDMRYHWDPQNGWRTMTLDKYRSYGDYNYQDPTSSVENARKAGAMSGDNRW